MPPRARTHRPWTIMVYMAGDNGKVFQTKYGKFQLMADMTATGYADIMADGAIGTTTAAAVICLFDTLKPPTGWRCARAPASRIAGCAAWRRSIPAIRRRYSTSSWSRCETTRPITMR